MATLSPGWINPTAASTVTFIGNGTSWGTSAPTFSASGPASSGVSIGAVTVLSDLVATAPVTTSAATGHLTWTDSTTSATATHSVGHRPLHLIRRRRSR